LSLGSQTNWKLENKHTTVKILVTHLLLKIDEIQVASKKEKEIQAGESCFKL